MDGSCDHLPHDFVGRGTARSAVEGFSGGSEEPLYHAPHGPPPRQMPGRMLMKRLKTAKGRKVSSTRWLERQLNDPYVKRAKAENYRSRAAYKLLELDERFGLLKGVKAVVDLGIAPGGWSQVVRRKAPQASIVGIDLLPTDPIEEVTILEM